MNADSFLRQRVKCDSNCWTCALLFSRVSQQKINTGKSRVLFRGEEDYTTGTGVDRDADRASVGSFARRQIRSYQLPRRNIRKFPSSRRWDRRDTSRFARRSDPSSFSVEKTRVCRAPSKRGRAKFGTVTRCEGGFARKEEGEGVATVM